MGSGCSHEHADNPSTLSLKHYEMHRVIGQGGFGKVNAVIRKKTKPPQWFAIKTLAKGTVVKKDCVKMVWNERNLLASLRASPYVVRMHHAFQDQENCYVVMDLLLGGDLKFHLRNTFKTGLKSESDVRFYVAGVLLALRDLHNSHILHRDVKMDNILLDNKGYPRLTDLGVSVYTENLRYRGNSGTPSHMAPELWSRNYDHGVASDLFSLGVVAFELAFAKRPWPNSVRPIIEANPDFLVSLPPEQFSNYFPNEILETATCPLSLPCRSFLRGLLHPVESCRLGFNGGVDEARAHEWFRDFDWASYEQQKLPAPIQPIIDENKGNFDSAAHDFDDVLASGKKSQAGLLSSDEQKLFEGFDYNVEIGSGS
ncbi:hypothetical protein P43SY_006345 [Pythium insidiosum]|uniref:AGC protein kinase n=1 Tax=Pythium insidiosum TaxID=114742 RepID=A0AAD5Q987_PYTIN|nr:hypothetical protein P43SY_006345 [Pythium insidiosum]